MKPLPNLEDTEAVLLRGKRSLLGSARDDATKELRDALTFVQSADWKDELDQRAAVAMEAAQRLRVLAAMWEEIDG